MALFAQDDDWIKARIRLSSVPDSSTDTLAIVDDSIAKARLSFYRRLGLSRVTKILTFALVDPPTDEEEILRAIGAQAELKLVLVDLLRRLPHAFMDASGNIQKRWNEEAPFRERPRSDVEREILRLNNEIEEEMQLLAGEDESIGSESEIKTYTGTPEETPPLPGDSILSKLSPFAED